MRRLSAILFAFTLAALSAASDRVVSPPPVLPPPLPPHPGTRSLPRFALFGWVAPPLDQSTPARYAELAAAGLNLTVLPQNDPGTAPVNLTRLACSAPVGVRNLLLDMRLDRVHEADPGSLATLDSIVSTYHDQPAFLGYYLGDEPSRAEFPRIAEFFRLLRTHDPTHPAWNNLFGRGVFASQADFLDYLRAYASEVAPAVLSTDHYDHTTTGERGLLIASAAGTAQVAREYGLPFWGIVLVTQHGPFRDPDDGLLRWQVAQYLAYGATGIGYFTYWTPAPEPTLTWGDGMIREGTGERTRHYTQVQALNARLRPMGEALAGLAWLSTEHAGGLPVGGTAFQADSLVTAVSGRVSLGVFATAAGEPCLFVANRDSAAAQDVALDLGGERHAWRFGDSGGWSPWPTSPVAGGRRLELTLAPGDFALFRLSGACGAQSSGACGAALSAVPNPATGRVRFAASAVQGGSTLVVLDPGGRRVWGRALAGDAPAVDWDGRADDGTRVRPGFYWARLTDARGSVVRRVAWLGAR